LLLVVVEAVKYGRYDDTIFDLLWTSAGLRGMHNSNVYLEMRQRLDKNKKAKVNIQFCGW